MYELGSIFTGTCLTSFYNLDNHSKKGQDVPNFNITTNININYLKAHNNTEKIYVIKMDGNVIDGNLLTSYIILGKEDAENLVRNCCQ